MTPYFLLLHQNHQPHPPIWLTDMISLEITKKFSSDRSIDPHLGKTNIMIINLLKVLWYIHTYTLGVYRYYKNMIFDIK